MPSKKERKVHRGNSVEPKTPSGRKGLGHKNLSGRESSQRKNPSGLKPTKNREMKRPWTPLIGSEPTYSRDQVIDAALKIGIERFTMASLAKEVGVVASALYREFESRDHIVQAAVAKAASQIKVPDANQSWQDQLRELVDAQWELFDKYPALSWSLFKVPVPHLAIQDQLRLTVENLVAAGIPGGAKRAGFALKILGDTVAQVHAVQYAMTEKDKSGKTLAERHVEEFEAHRDEFSVLMMSAEFPSERGFLPEKVEFIIEALEHPPRK
ncbi:MAG: TetR/AcrR family transcriptional regulator [Actinomycetaceae bacterium]|nr:TetR/AcrR family transcriptional regulator [Actinomycetaceae bacterium]